MYTLSINFSFLRCNILYLVLKLFMHLNVKPQPPLSSVFKLSCMIFLRETEETFFLYVREVILKIILDQYRCNSVTQRSCFKFQ